MGPYLVIVGYGDGEDMRDTLEVSYACDEPCGKQYVREALGFSDAEGTAGQATDYENPVTFTNGRETGDYPMVEYGYAPGSNPPTHEWCPNCGMLVEHGEGEDNEHFTCDPIDCNAPEYVEVEG